MKQSILLSFIIIAVATSAEARRRSAPSYPENFKEESYLKEQIEQTGLDDALPVELRDKCEGKDKAKVWTQLMIGLSFIESKWRDNDVNGCDANCTPSVGLFQMTGPSGRRNKGDIALGEACFKTAAETKDSKKNIRCAVRKMKELMNKNPSLTKSASRYWGPFGRRQYSRKGKGGSLVAMVAATCGGQNKRGSIDDYNYGGDEGGLATNNREYWEQVDNYTPYSTSAERRSIASTKRSSRRYRQAAR